MHFVMRHYEMVNSVCLRLCETVCRLSNVCIIICQTICRLSESKYKLLTFDIMICINMLHYNTFSNKIIIYNSHNNKGSAKGGCCVHLWTRPT